MMIAKGLLLVTLLAVSSAGAYGAATMRMESGRIVDLDQMYRDSKGKCCVSVFDVGLGSENTIMRMDGSGGKYFVTNDPNCGNVIYSSSYPTTFSNIYLCGQCKGGCPQVDGGKIIVSRGGMCTKQDGSTDVYLVCERNAPICQQPIKSQPGKCATYADTQVNPPQPAVCAQFAQLGQYCNDMQGQCCGGSPKNAKCENNKCVTTYPTPPPTPVPAPGPVACASFANMGQDCNLGQGRCCGGGPKNAKCENGKCVTTYPTGPAGVTPAGRK